MARREPKEREKRGPLARVNSVHVSVRFFPRSDGAPLSDIYLFHPTQPCVLVHDPLQSVADQEFRFDSVFGDKTPQLPLYERLGKPMVDEVLKGEDCTLFVTGQTGSGKRHTLVGTHDRDGYDGLVPTILTNLFEQIDIKRVERQKNIGLFFNLYQVHPDQVVDCIRPTARPPKSEARSLRTSPSMSAFDRPRRSVTPRGMNRSSSRASVQSESWGNSPGAPPKARDGPPIDARDLFVPRRVEVIEKGDGIVAIANAGTVRVSSFLPADVRAISELLSMAVSTARPGRDASVAHTVLTFTVVQENGGKRSVASKGSASIKSRLSFVVMAEQELAHGQEGRRTAKDNKKINRSYTALSKVLIAHAKNDLTYVDFRGSELTRLLESSLTSLSSTVVLMACVNPDPDNFDESVKTLTYTQTCRFNEASANLDPDMDKDLIIKRLIRELADAKKEMTEVKESYSKALLRKSNRPPSPVQVQPNTRKKEDTSFMGEIAQLSRQVESLNEEKAELHTRLQKLKKDFLKVQRHLRAVESQNTYILDEYREKVRELETAMEADQLRFENKEKEGAVAREAHVRNLIQSHKEVLEEQFELMQATKKNFQSTSRENTDNDVFRKEVQAAAQQSNQAVIKALESAHAKHMEEMETQWNTKLTDQNIKWQELAHTLRKTKQTAKENEDQLASEVEYLLQYVQHLAGLVVMIERQTYPVHEKSGIKTTKLPTVRRPGALDLDICEVAKGLIANAQKVIDRHGAGDELEAGREIYQPARATISVDVESDVFAMDIAAMRGHVQALRTELVSTAEQLDRTKASLKLARNDNARKRSETMRPTTPVEKQAGAFKEKVITELASDSTVKYISKLEDDVEHYKALLSTEQTRSQNLRVALMSKDRLLARPATGTSTKPNTGWATDRGSRRRRRFTPQATNRPMSAK